MNRNLAIALTVLLMAAGCRKAPEEAPVHELTPIEQSKKNLDILGESIAKALKMDSDEDVNIFELLLSQGHVSAWPPGTFKYTLQGEEGNALEIDLQTKSLTRTAVTVFFPDDMYLDGEVDMARFLKNLHIKQTAPITTALDCTLDITLYCRDEPVATLGLEPEHVNESGKNYWTMVPVFRFTDGTSYSVSSVLLIDQFIDYFLKYEGDGVGA